MLYLVAYGRSTILFSLGGGRMDDSVIPQVAEAEALPDCGGVAGETETTTEPVAETVAEPVEEPVPT